MALKTQESWKPVTHIKGTSNKKYAVSSKGRLASYSSDFNTRYILKTHLNGGLPMATIYVNGKSKALFSHLSVAYAFVKKTASSQKYVIHIDYNKKNNDVSNLKWVSRKQQIEHHKNNPTVLKATERKVYTGATARKLDEKKVIALKKEIWNPKRKATLKQLAEKYGIAEMNLYRIKKGELWFHIHIDGEPMHPKYIKQLKNIEFHNKEEKKSISVEKPNSNKKSKSKDNDLKKKKKDKKKNKKKDKKEKKNRKNKK